MLSAPEGGREAGFSLVIFIQLARRKVHHSLHGGETKNECASVLFNSQLRLASAVRG